jgi:hypothetical protein
VSYVGGKYEFDLFISYAHAVASSDPEYKSKNNLRGWSQCVAQLLEENLSPVLNAGQVEERRFRIYIDIREMDSGEDISTKLREAAGKSACLLILMSPYYLESEYCRQEVEAFFASQPEPGHCLLREIMSTRGLEEQWPKELRGADGKVVNRGDPFYDPQSQRPIDFMQYQVSAPMPNLAAPADILINSVKKRLQNLRKKVDITATFEINHQPVRATQPPPPDPLPPGSKGPKPPKMPLYLQAESRNRDDWLDARSKLEGLALVNPEDLEPGQEDLPLIATYHQRRLKMLPFCQGLLLLRARQDDDIELQLMAASYARDTVYQEWQRLLPWVVLDKVDRDEPAFRRYEVARVPTSTPDWPKLVVEQLRGGAAKGA